MQVNMYQKILSAYLLFLVLFWTILNTSQETTSTYNFLYSFLFGLIPLIGGIFGIIKSKDWGRFQSDVGKGLFFVSLGLFAWGMGAMVWSYYNFFLAVPAPYPSLADLGFGPSIILYGIGAIYLSRYSGASYGIQNKYLKIFSVIAPIFILFISYYILVVIARDGVLIGVSELSVKTVLDVLYPFGDFLALSLAVVLSGLSVKYMSGKYVAEVIAVYLGLAVMFIGDTIFSYTTTIGTFYNGNFGDLVLTLGLFLLTYGALGFCKIKS